MLDTAERIEMLREAQDKLREAVELIREAVDGTRIEGLAHAYVIPHLEVRIDDDHSWLGNDDNLQDFIEMFSREEDEQE